MHACNSLSGSSCNRKLSLLDLKGSWEPQWSEASVGLADTWGSIRFLPAEQTFSHLKSEGQNPERMGFLLRWLRSWATFLRGSYCSCTQIIQWSCRLGEKRFTLGQQPVSRKAMCYVRMLRAYPPGLEMETILVCSIDFLKCISSMVF